MIGLGIKLGFVSDRWWQDDGVVADVNKVSPSRSRSGGASSYRREACGGWCVP